ncbi:MAG: hypothetical protein GX348_08955 [Veillonellaceae bacterium]|jgi:3D (Asp-Asp-Asp) domain-containing protein|nr:hypothetical protein [Veillonellaceae bacterium]
MLNISVRKLPLLVVVFLITGIFTQIVSAMPSDDIKSEIQNKKVINATATAYAPGPHDNGKWGNLTHIGTQVRPGVIAVDPNIIPLGTKLYIEFSNEKGMYGVAEDTGGAIKGNRIDIAMWTVSEALDFGMQKVKVYIIE